MSTSISGGIHLGGDDGAPYLDLHINLDPVANIDLSIGPNGADLVPGSSLIGGLLDALPPAPPVGPIVSAVSDVVGAVPLSVPTLTSVVGSVLDLGGTAINTNFTLLKLN